jgi:hypothetical protein
MSTMVIDESKLVKFAGILYSILRDPAISFQFKHDIETYTATYYKENGFTWEQVAWDDGKSDCFIIAMFKANHDAYNFDYPDDTYNIDDELEIFKPLLAKRPYTAYISDHLTVKDFQELGEFVTFMNYNSFSMSDNQMNSSDKTLQNNLKNLSKAFYRHALKVHFGSHGSWGSLETSI